jgi:hypothetical protein
MNESGYGVNVSPLTEAISAGEADAAAVARVGLHSHSLG